MDELDLEQHELVEPGTVEALCPAEGSTRYTS